MKRSILDLKLKEPVFVTSPSLPKFEDYTKCLEQIWQSKHLTNDGPFLKKFELSLGQYLGVERISPFCNGAIALLVALQALRIQNCEVITTPFTFPATPHVLDWNGATPVFCDIDPKTLNIDASKIAPLITPRTRAILAVHVYGFPCAIEEIQAIADTYGLQVIYDAAHTFGAKYKGRALCDYGDIGMLSFHATKLFSTIEGGALVSHSDAVRQRIAYLRNFGIANADTVVGPGINGKMNEFEAAYGLLMLNQMDDEIRKRNALADRYRELLSGIAGITVFGGFEGLTPNDAYFPILIDAEKFGVGRNELFALLAECNVNTRKYFYPLCSHYPCYSALPSASAQLLPVAERVAEQVLCLPLFGTLPMETVDTISEIIKRIAEEHASKGQ
ncbi:DegT/DnrJ/EryC1/StrS family aminotransferase [Candidatus Sumerlaeota bacterium]|nr:DegT/DnrJ/EryC1/StrS family aminotransferase [Candidatus Sumerlaeota bacterium]